MPKIASFNHSYYLKLSEVGSPYLILSMSNPLNQNGVRLIPKPQIRFIPMVRFFFSKRSSFFQNQKIVLGKKAKVQCNRSPKDYSSISTRSLEHPMKRVQSRSCINDMSNGITMQLGKIKINFCEKLKKASSLFTTSIMTFKQFFINYNDIATTSLQWLNGFSNPG